jgi:hypothetical protein
MKSMIAAALMLFSLRAMAADYQCFSYNTYKQILANTDTGTVIVKDRFGNELDVIGESTTNIRILATVPETVEVQFIKNDQVVVHIQEQGEFIHAVYGDDESFHCRARKTSDQ